MIEKGKQISLFEFIQILELFPNVEYQVTCKNFYLYEHIPEFHALYKLQDLGQYISHKNTMLPVTADELIIGPVTIFKDGALVHDYMGFSKIIKLECWGLGMSEETEIKEGDLIKLKDEFMQGFSTDDLNRPFICKEIIDGNVRRAGYRPRPIEHFEKVKGPTPIEEHNSAV